MISNEPHNEKNNNVDSEQVPHKANCISTDDGSRLESLDLNWRICIRPVAKTMVLINFMVTDLRLCFVNSKMLVFP